MNELILHAYDASPFTRKALLMLGIKGARWRWVETPMLPPKDDLLTLTGGYRGTPVLQHGADVWIDTQAIARALDALLPEPPLLPPGAGGLALMLVKWSDQFFRCALYRAIHQTAGAWDRTFLDDRRFLFPDIDFAAVAEDVDHRTAQFQAHVALLAAQLADDRPFLGGEAPTLLDVQAWPFLWMSRPLAGTDELLEGFPLVAAWEARMGAIGEGTREALGAEDALAAARRATPAAPEPGGTAAPGPAPGSTVTVEPDDTRRGGVTGELLVLSPERVVVRHEHARCGIVHVHFPRIGYRVSPA